MNAGPSAPTGVPVLDDPPTDDPAGDEPEHDDAHEAAAAEASDDELATEEPAPELEEPADPPPIDEPSEPPPVEDAPSPFPAPMPLLTAPLAILTAIVTLAFLMFLLIEPTPRWIALFGAGVATLGTEGVLRSARGRSFQAGLDPTPQLFLPALYALVIPVFIEHNARGLWVPPIGLLAGAGFGAIVAAEVASVRAHEPQFDTARTVAGGAVYLTAFALFSLTYSFELVLPPAILAAALISGLLAIELLRDGIAEPLDVLGLSAVAAVIVGQMRWTLHFVPLDGHLAALGLLLAFFFASGVLHAHVTRHLQRNTVFEYSGIVAAGIVLIVAARAADLA